MTLELTGVAVAEALASSVRLGVLRFDGVTVRPSTGADSRTEIPSAALEEIERVANARIHLVRAMYRQFGMDPTKTRPSSEALLRRLRCGQPWPQINTLVDLCNRCSLETQLPYGLYDVDQIVGAVDLRVGGHGAEYAGIGRPVVHVEGRPALFDEHGPFGNPTSDSVRTMITVRTTRVLVVVYGPRALDRAELDAVLDLTAQRLSAHGVSEKRRWIEPCE